MAPALSLREATSRAPSREEIEVEQILRPDRAEALSVPAEPGELLRDLDAGPVAQ